MKSTPYLLLNPLPIEVPQMPLLDLALLAAWLFPIIVVIAAYAIIILSRLPGSSRVESFDFDVSASECKERMKASRCWSADGRGHVGRTSAARIAPMRYITVPDSYPIRFTSPSNTRAQAPNQPMFVHMPEKNGAPLHGSQNEQRWVPLMLWRGTLSNPADGADFSHAAALPYRVKLYLN